MEIDEQRKYTLDVGGKDLGRRIQSFFVPSLQETHNDEDSMLEYLVLGRYCGDGAYRPIITAILNDSNDDEGKITHAWPIESVTHIQFMEE